MPDVIALLQTGESVESVVANCFLTLTRTQVYECLAYYEDHRGEIDLLVSRHDTDGSMTFFFDHDVPEDAAFAEPWNEPPWSN